MSVWGDFEISVGGKWVLAGEHSVIRGTTAIALPLMEHQLVLQFEPSREGTLRIRPEEHAPLIRELINSVEDQWQAGGRSFPRPSGTVSIQSTIPLGAGMGSSAALCVALTRWFQSPLSLQENEIFEFARQLEHRFHGRSSGMDIAVILAGQPISYSIAKGAIPLGIRRTPRFTFHDTGLRARTSDCIHQVELLREEKPAYAFSLDERMGTATRHATEGLMVFDRGNDEAGLRAIAGAMNEAHECFLSWGLVPNEAARLRQDLLDQGALAVKLTGAGGGGMLVAVWNRMS